MTLFSQISSGSTITRRQVVFGAIAAATVQSLPVVANDDDSLKARGARQGITFGTEVTLGQLRSMPELGAAVSRDCAIIVPGIEMKWGETDKRRGTSNYANAELIAAFAKQNGIALRGHTAMWYRNTPKWTDDLMSGPAGRNVMLKRVGDIVRHFKGRVVEWDVVNEAIEPADGLAGDIRKWPAFAIGDPGYIADCFHAAHEADPDALLCYNDFGFEYNSANELRRRASALNLIEELQKRGAPVQVFGIQCHLVVGNDFQPERFRKFLSDIAALGLKISLTELDVSDRRLPTDIVERDRQVAAHAKQFLDVAFDERAVRKLLTWGFSDKDSWLNSSQPRSDGLKQRPLPLDENLARTPLWEAIGHSMDNAPLRA